MDVPAHVPMSNEGVYSSRSCILGATLCFHVAVEMRPVLSRSVARLPFVFPRHSSVCPANVRPTATQKHMTR